MFPPSCAVRATPEERVVGMQRKSARPMARPVGWMGRAATAGATKGVSARIDTNPDGGGGRESKVAAGRGWRKSEPVAATGVAGWVGGSRREGG